MFDLTKKIGIIGLGYVGLPLAIEFGKKYRVIGYDVSESRIDDLTLGVDRTNEADLNELKSVIELFSSTNNKGLFFSSNSDDLLDCNIFIVTVPTPINEFKTPDLSPLLNASGMIGKILKRGDIVIYESTVYPGCTEDDCVPILEKSSGLKFNIDFFCGYSPERINPGDKINTLTKIKKVTSGSTPKIADIVDNLYSSIIVAGTHRAPNIKVAEASKAIENAQRDINISFVNELSLMFDLMGIDTNDVLEAANTKWNFLNFKPGLVGGHCIGVDPYYLAYKAESLGYIPNVILSGRRVNDNMGIFIANKIVKMLIASDHLISSSKILILGITFKEDCPDIRNTKVVDILNELKQFNIKVDVYDPQAIQSDVFEQYGLTLINQLNDKYDCIVLAVSHKEFRDLNLVDLKRNSSSIVFDIKSFFPKELVNARL